MLSFLRTYRLGLIIGFLFGTLGLWILAMLSLANSLVERTTSFLFAFSRLIGTALSDGNSMSTPQVVVAILLTGLFYALIGALVQHVVRMLRRKV